MAFLSLHVAAIDLDSLATSAGFTIEFFAKGVKNARQMALSPNGIVYVGSRRAGNVYALQDSDNDGISDKRWLIANNLTQPSGLAFKDGALYVADIGNIYKFDNIDNTLSDPKSTIVFSDLPDDVHHGWKFIRFAANGDLVIPVGAPCNICTAPTAKHSRILSLNLKTKELTELAQGVRNSLGFDFHPVTGELWFSENGRDLMGDDIPPDEINKVSKLGQHFGYPFFHAGNIADPEYSKGKDPKEYTFPELLLGAHVAPLGIHFYKGKQFPKQYKHQLFVTEHGSWNRSKKSGYKVAVATIENNKIVKYTPFITGFMKDEEIFGRPAAILEMPDGSLLISDDYANVIYRVRYNN